MTHLRALGDDVQVLQTRLWQTNGVVARAGEEALLCDPCFTAEEIATLAEAAREGGGPIHLLVTHGDYDHVCGIGYLPEATVVTGAETAERITSGEAGEQLAAAGVEWGISWPTELRVDRVVEPGRVECGAFAVEALDARGHTRDGLAYALLDHGVLLPGDHLSDMTYPFILGPLDQIVETTRRLLEALERLDLRWVVPGHGRPLTPDEAKTVGEADLAYLESLERAVAEARADGLAPGEAVLHVFEVEPPRETTPDFEVYALRSFNARSVLGVG